ncbi:Protein of unknown function DUF3602 [Aspergillus parasiticus SU-1]|uniref:Uncharacterized protein n=5 Tax=Aspergillus subgen. Circumdati TaxID=2720871 RepID=A0A5N6E5T1_ASPPA|nr:hypothetical protein BDV34DRAFT_218879 [Aspergillus parasiticus]KAB8224960.1 hypothetical protein BDV33DRAFT_136541 [Aspergillus novoparasiticus]KAE8318711.1 hypothetical protein BDV41DRAFT_571630 [Aspergillus transmontanensis]KAE8330669.1 hypothetical protein BDV39DRAFT_201689 [Aspergillus sergii]KJK63070.1 Protein of unknown function DUF3602 [Aspergillus parasiticus SU-1]
MSRYVSHGRGGAGNIFSSESHTTPKDLVTPTIKQDIYTTGRGGSGNMVVNDPQRPEIARESQDVEAPPLRVEEAPHHTGRGGAANAYIPSSEEEKKAREEEEEQLRRIRTASRDRLKDAERAAEKRSESSSS